MSNNIDEVWQKKPDTKENMYDSIYIKFEIRQNWYLAIKVKIMLLL